jgi:16S rRNA G527 N7-methylase RsmG
LAGEPFLPATGALVDVGSGNGFPAVPLLLARPALSGVLLEPRERRWAFLREVGRELGLSAAVLRENIREHVGSYAALTVRGVDRGVWWPQVGRLLAAGGVALWWHTGEPGLGHDDLDRVVTSPLPDPGRGWLSVWRRCST